MSTFTDVFERKEVKYRLNARQYQVLSAVIAKHMVLDEFGRTSVTSLYFDTPTRSLVERSLDKPLYKEKFRMRRYGSATTGDRVFLEIKKKFDGIVYKRRVSLSHAAAYAYMNGMAYESACVRYPLADPVMADESLGPRSIQIAREIDSFVMRYRPLRPSMMLVCDRSAYTAVDDDEVRITFDTDVAYRDMFRMDSKNDPLMPLIKPGEVIMEVKVSHSFPLWLVRALRDCQAYPSSFSKYGEAYCACLAGISDGISTSVSTDPSVVSDRGIPLSPAGGLDSEKEVPRSDLNEQGIPPCRGFHDSGRRAKEGACCV